MSEDEQLQRYFGAVAALERGEVDAARRELESLALESPRFAPIWDGLGNCRVAEGNLETAADCYRKAIRLDRRNWRSRYNWAVALHRAGELRDACRLLRVAAGIAPQERRIHQRLGLCHYDLGEHSIALRWLRTALEQPERDVPDAELQVQIGNVEADRGEFAAAEQAYERACLFAPDDPEVYFNWAQLCARSGDLDGAERLGIRARALDRRSLRAPLLLVRLAMDSLQWERAAQRIEELSAFPDGQRLAMALRAELARRTGNPDGATTLVLRTLVLEGPPSDHAVDSALATLREVHGIRSVGQGYRLLVEVICGSQAYYRPYVVLAEGEEQARRFVAELQDSLDPSPWSIVESERFESREEALAGVYQLLLTRVLFPRGDAFYSSSEPEHRYR